MLKNFRLLLALVLATGVVGVGRLPEGITASALEANEENNDAIALKKPTVLAQVNSVSELSDIQPED